MLSVIAAMLTAAVGPVFVAKACQEPEVASKARCGTVMVPESRSRSTGRQIDLNVIVIPATRPAADPKALFDLEGGPGLADTKNAGFYLTDGAAYSAERDVVLIDQRGTGQSNPLDCPEIDAADRSLEPMYPVTAVWSCRERLGRAADLTQYDTTNAVADLEAVREALGYTKIDLFALSYGTTLALRYIAAHGAKVRSAVLLSAVPAAAMPPRHHSTAAQAALNQLFADCEADVLCNAQFPNLHADLDLALRKLHARGIDTAVAMERLRTKLYSPGGIREVPWIVHQLAKGQSEVLTSGNARAAFNYYEGVYLSITCSESLPWFNQEKATVEARQTTFGDYRLSRQRMACANWPRAFVQSSFFAPVRSSVPILFLSGGRDPVTPADWASETAQGFSNSRQIIIPWAGHIVDGLSGLDTCFDPQILRFIDTADPSSVDAACFKEMKPPPFKVEN